MADLKRSEGTQADSNFAPPMSGELGEEAGTVRGPEGHIMWGAAAEPQPGNQRKIH